MTQLHESPMWDIIKRSELDITEPKSLMEAKGGAELVESVIFTKDLQDSLGIDLGKEGWFVGFRITDDNLLQKVQDGTYTMFSIGGVCTKEDIDE